MVPIEYVWLVWSAAFLVPWLALYAIFARQRRVMLWASVFTAPFGLTEPLFVPAYWNPPSLFGLAQRTGFDIESVVFCFGIGGVGAVLYNLLTGRSAIPVTPREARHRRHRYHRLALALPFLVFPFLYLLPWNPIYPAIAALAVGALATALCRPDLGRKTIVGALIFTAYYAVFLTGLELTSPGYINDVWNLPALSGWSLAYMPVEELLFAIGFGAYWSGIYEHVTWSTVSHGPGRD